MNYNQWNTFEIDYIGSVVTAHVNGVLKYTETADRGTARMIAAFIETYKTNGGAWYTTGWSIAAAVTSTLEGCLIHAPRSASMLQALRARVVKPRRPPARVPSDHSP